MLPVDFPTDRETIEAALSTLGLVGPDDTKIVWIRNTLDLAEVECSAGCLDEVRSRADLEAISELRPWPFDAEGNLPIDGVRALGAAGVGA